MGFAVMATAVTVVVIFIAAVAAVAHGAYVSMAKRKRQAALDYLLKATDRMYFYGQPVARCLEKGVVWELAWDGVGDFARPMGCLVLYALGALGSGNARICWSERYDHSAGQSYYLAYVIFDYCGWQWILDLRGHGLDESSFKRYKGSKDLESASYEYWDVSRRDRHLVENCTDPERSDLAPDFHYREMELREFEQETEHQVMFLTI